MAGLITVRLSRSDAQPWGFRLQGGKDFGAPLLIQKVNGGSLAEKAGLQVADAVIKVNGQDVYNLRHKDAQDTIVKAGNSFEVVVSRGPGGTWKPAVTPVGNLPSPSSVGGAPSPVTKTSLAYKGPASPVIGTGHNVAAKPFSNAPQLNGVGGQASVKSITSKQYNNPVGLYSEQTIAETLSAQAEVLAGGVLGVNFMKNEKTYKANNSEVLKMVQEIDNEPREPEPEPVAPGGVVTVPPPSALGLRHVVAPETKPPSAANTQAPLQPGQNTCADCERLIVGVFVRIKDKNLHVECFKCATCGTSLKNVGYYNINNKLYCDVHAKLVARSNPPAPNLDPITIPPGGRIPPGAMPAPAPLPSKGPQSPQPGTLAPLPFHAPTSNFSGPKPFGAPASAPAPFSTPSAPMSAPAPAPFSSVPTPPAAPHQTISFPPAAPQQTISFPPAAPIPTPPSMLSFSKNLPDFQRPIDFQLPFYGFGRLSEKRPGGAPKSGSTAGTSAPRRGRGVLNTAVSAGGRIPLCGSCNNQIRGPFITALGKIWCPEHFVCVNAQCRRQLQDIGFVEDAQGLYCEYCFEQYLAPSCSKCNAKVKGDCLNAIGKHFHPECFTCAYCGKLFGNSPFFLEDALPYCETDWNELFTTKCFSCGFPIEAGDRWVEALSNNYHSQCFNCSMCKKNLEGQSFFAKGGRPFCKNHAR